ncbi:UvrD-helicase domain-containing protein [Winogradskyella sp. SM1960]|uniref:UvrD-helicase domain-containing protein n=1 Tax=Winogradskyella sp. SM1960 TaxID=2865955 RepID=UPI001CD47F6B|nr:UvrD-helicase domain-containing protein [Winogradskyella sp. SM1960]
MPQVIDITDDDIRYAEKILLPIGKEFDDERIAFIRDFRTIDLQAVPGSGKTTVLLAKLIILERKLPFSDGSGILVLSHTNTAINEIKEKIQKHCPKLFSYPNYIGTIQSFVNEFMAIPYYVQMFKKKPNRIDHEIYNEKIKNFIEKPWLYKLNLNKTCTDKVAYIKNNNEGLFYNYRFESSNKVQLIKKLNGEVLEINKPRGNTKTANYRDYTHTEKKEVYKWFFEFKQSILKSGILHYDDAYFLAERYLIKFPNIKSILQKRFSFVFVDEMQDMETHQCSLLEKIFYDNGNSISKIQRIGDKNQAIYNSVKATDVWQDRSVVLRLNGSQRLSKPIADVVKKFALYSDENFDIVGRNKCTIKPHILVFENTNIENVIPCFAQIVRENDLVNSEKPIKVVCWNTEWKEDEKSRNDVNKHRLEDYHKTFKKDIGKPKLDYNNLKSYLLYFEKKQTLEPIRKNILNAFLKILRLENVNTKDDRPFTKKKLIDFIKEKDVKKYDELNLNLYNWSIGIIQEKTIEVWNEIKEYVPTFLTMFDKAISLSSNFINADNVEIITENAEISTPTNHYRENGLEIEITSVHAVKGQTHCATLYLESYFHQDGRGLNAKSYESQRLQNQFLGSQILSTVGKRVKESTKMAYVGFSRPTDLLCVAVHRDRFDSFLSEIDRDVWKIMEVTNNRD